MVLVVEVNQAPIGSLFWELPDIPIRTIGNPEVFKESLKADLQDLMGAVMDMVMANIQSDKLTEVGFQPIQDVLLTANEELRKRLDS